MIGKKNIGILPYAHTDIGSKLTPPLTKEDSDNIADYLENKGFLNISRSLSGESSVNITGSGKQFVIDKRADPLGVKADFEKRKYDLLWDAIKVIVSFIIGGIIGFITGYLSHH